MMSCLDNGVLDRRASIEFVRDLFGGKTKAIAEIGVLYGENALRMKEMLNPDKFYLIDKIRSAELANATWLIGDSIKMARLIPDGSLDFAYIDADHSFQKCLADLIAYFPKISPGGILAGHDFLKSPRNEGVAKACNLFFGEDHYLTRENSLDWWVIR
jgi:predicted O-methyltransferase YrrM